MAKKTKAQQLAEILKKYIVNPINAPFERIAAETEKINKSIPKNQSKTQRALTAFPEVAKAVANNLYKDLPVKNIPVVGKPLAAVPAAVTSYIGNRMAAPMASIPKGAYDTVQSARKGDYLGAGGNALMTALNTLYGASNIVNPIGTQAANQVFTTLDTLKGGAKAARKGTNLLGGMSRGFTGEEYTGAGDVITDNPKLARTINTVEQAAGLLIPAAHGAYGYLKNRGAIRPAGELTVAASEIEVPKKGQVETFLPMEVIEGGSMSPQAQIGRVKQNQQTWKKIIAEGGPDAEDAARRLQDSGPYIKRLEKGLGKTVPVLVVDEVNPNMTVAASEIEIPNIGPSAKKNLINTKGWVKDKTANPNDVLVVVDANKLNKVGNEAMTDFGAEKQITRLSEGPFANKLDRAKDFISKNNEGIMAPTVSFDKNGEIRTMEGAHRFRAVKEMGDGRAVVSIPSDKIDVAKKQGWFLGEYGNVPANGQATAESLSQPSTPQGGINPSNYKKASDFIKANGITDMKSDEAMKYADMWWENRDRAFNKYFPELANDSEVGLKAVYRNLIKQATYYDTFDEFKRSLHPDQYSQIGSGMTRPETALKELYDDVSNKIGRLEGGRFMINPETGTFIRPEVKRGIQDFAHQGDWIAYEKNIKNGVNVENFDNFVRGTIKDGKVNIYFDPDRALPDLTDAQRLSAIQKAAKQLMETQNLPPTTPIKIGLKSEVVEGKYLGEFSKAKTIGELISSGVGKKTNFIQGPTKVPEVKPETMQVPKRNETNNRYAGSIVVDKDTGVKIEPYKGDYNLGPNAFTVTEPNGNVFTMQAKDPKNIKQEVKEYLKTMHPELKPINPLRGEQEPIGKLTNSEGVVARQRFDIPKLQKISFGGSDRDVYDLGNGMVLKIAKNSRGLDQNMQADYYAEREGLIPEVIEKGKNYVVFEKVAPPDVKTKKMISELKKVGSPLEWVGNNKRINETKYDNIVKVMQKYGYNGEELGNYGRESILWNDLFSIRNWGTKKGVPILVDEGTLNGQFISEHTAKKGLGQTNLDDPLFRQIYNESKAAKKLYGDRDSKTMYGLLAPLFVGASAALQGKKQKKED